jgi:hypothetical protein
MRKTGDGSAELGDTYAKRLLPVNPLCDKFSLPVVVAVKKR